MKYIHMLTFQTVSKTVVYTVKSENRILPINEVYELMEQYGLDVNETVLINHTVFLNEENN